jgi:hypothetical protein
MPPPASLTPAALSAGGNPMLHVASLYVDRKTRAILGAIAMNVYPSDEACAYALTIGGTPR